MHPLAPPNEAKFVEKFGLIVHKNWVKLKNNHGLREQQCININALAYFNELFIRRIVKEGIVLVERGEGEDNPWFA